MACTSVFTLLGCEKVSEQLVVEVIELNETKQRYLNIRKVGNNGRPFKTGLCLTLEEFADFKGLISEPEPIRYGEKRKIHITWNSILVRLDKPGKKQSLSIFVTDAWRLQNLNIDDIIKRGVDCVDK